jgi:hypothetical protein
MRVKAIGILKSGGGEWSDPLQVTVPPQPAPVTEEQFDSVKFTYE